MAKNEGLERKIAMQETHKYEHLQLIKDLNTKIE